MTTFCLRLDVYLSDPSTDIRATWPQARAVNPSPMTKGRRILFTGVLVRILGFERSVIMRGGLSHGQHGDRRLPEKPKADALDGRVTHKLDVGNQGWPASVESQQNES